MNGTATLRLTITSTTAAVAFLGATPVVAAEPCRAQAGDAKSITDVADERLIAAALPAASGKTLVVDTSGTWRDCHGNSGMADHEPRAILGVSVMGRLEIDERHTHVLLRVGEDALIASVRLDNGVVTAYATKPVFAMGGEPLLRTIVGKYEVVWFCRGDDVPSELAVGGAVVSGRGTVWSGNATHNDGDYRAFGQIVERFTADACTMVVDEPWRVIKDEVVTHESWSVPSSGGGRKAPCSRADHGTATVERSIKRAYRMTEHGGAARIIK